MLTLVILLRVRGDRRRADDAADPGGLQPPGRRTRPTSSPADARLHVRDRARQDRAALERRGPNLATYAARPARGDPGRHADGDAVYDDAERALLRARRSRRRSSSTAGAWSRAPMKVDGRRRHRLRAVRAAALGRPGDRQPRAVLPRPRRARRRRAGAAGRPGDRAARDGADRRADRAAARHDRAHARPVACGCPAPEAEDEVAELARTLEGMLARARRGARGDRGDAGAPARVRRRRLARAAHAADLGAGEPRAARGGCCDGEQREAAASALRSSRRMRRLVGRPAAARARRRRARSAAPAGRPLRASSPRRPPSSSRSPATTRSPSPRPPGARSRARATSCTGSRST